MGSYEIFYRSSDESIQSITKVVTPSPLTSSGTSDGSSSLLVGIEDLISEVSARPFGKHEEETSGAEAEGGEHWEVAGSPQRPREESFDRETTEECRTDSAGASLESSASSLKRRLRDLPAPSEAIKLADRVAALDRRIRRERDVYLQLQGQADRIEETEEPEVDSPTGSSSVTSIKHLFNEDPKTVEDPRARRRVKMCSSAPETMRLNGESFEQSLSSEVTTTLKKSLAKKFEDRRPPKYLEPINVPVKEILRCNAPALCISDKKIAELLRRGSVSAREEYIKRSAMLPAKLADTGRPTGMIIKNLSSGSEEDCTSHWLIRGGFSVPKFKTEASILDGSNFRCDGSAVNDKSSIPRDTSDDRRMVDREESKSLDHPRSSMVSITAQKPAQNGEALAIEDNEMSDDLPSAEVSGRLTKTSLQSSMDRLKSVLKELESNSRDSRKLNVPKLEIHSRECSQSVSLSSREDPAKRSLDMSALFRALSDVSIKQQDAGGRRVEPGLCESVVSTAPMSSPYTSMADGSRQSMSSAENAESQELKTDHSKTLRGSRGSLVRDKKIERTDGSSNGRSKIPISAGEANVVSKACGKEPRKIARGKIVAEETRVPALERSSKRIDTGSSPKKRSPEYRSGHPARIHSPEMRKNRKSKTSPMTDDSSMREKSSGLAKNGFPSFETLAKNLAKHERNKKLTTGPNAVSSEPGTSRNDRRVLRDRLSSRGASGARDILPRVLGHDPGSSDERFKYLQRGSKLPYSRSSGSSSSEPEVSDFELKIIRPSATGFQSADRLQSEAKFKIHEDTDDASSPGTEPAYSVEKDCRRTPNSSPRKSKPAESGNLFQDDSSTESNRAMSCSLESRIEVAKNAAPEARPYLVSPANGSMKRTSSSSQLTGSSSKIRSNGSPIGSGSGGSSGCRYAGNARLVSNHLAEGSLEDFKDEVGRKFQGESIFTKTSVVKRLSYSESRAPRSEDNSDEEQLPFRAKRPPEDQPEVSSPDEEFIEDAAANSSRTHLAGAGTSDSNLGRFGKVLDRAKTGSKFSSSLSKLARSPEEPNLAARRRSQDRFPFTISESTSARSSAKSRVKNAIREATSGCVTIGPSETAYKLRAHPSFLRLAGAGYEATAAEIIDSASRDPVVMVGHGNFVEKFVRKFSGRRRLRKKRNGSASETTEVLYENKECRVGSTEESSESNAVEKPGRAFNRDGLWVEGPWDKNRSGGELPGMEEQDIIDRYAIFLAKRDQHRRQFGESALPPETPMNSAEVDDDRDIEPGCFCAKVCKFFIGGNINYRKRSTLFLRARNSRLRRRF